MTVPLARQKEIVVEHRRQATHALIAFIGRYQEQIEALAVERLSTLGADQYGDASFHKSHAQLWRETMEELADAVVYRAIRLHMDATA